MKIMKNEATGEKLCVLLLDGLSSVLEIKTKEEALKMAKVFSQNSDSGWVYEVRSGGKKVE